MKAIMGSLVRWKNFLDRLKTSTVQSNNLQLINRPINLVWHDSKAEIPVYYSKAVLETYEQSESLKKQTKEPTT
jgi:hypothetical protein